MVLKLAHRVQWSTFVSVLIVLCLTANYRFSSNFYPATPFGLKSINFGQANALQSVKGEQQSIIKSKTSGSFASGSKFRDNISQVKRKQQQQQQQQLQQQVVEQQNEIVVEQKQILQRPIVQQRVVQEQTSYEVQQNQQQQSIDSEAVAEPTIYGSVKGTPGVDFPNYSQIPNTKFVCEGAPFDPGMYADENTGCQVYHMCYQGRRESFLCGVGTVFNQAIMNCDFWHSVDCSKSSQFYQLNADFGKSSSEPASGSLQSAISQQTLTKFNNFIERQQLEQQPIGGTKGISTSRRRESSLIVEAPLPPPRKVASNFVSQSAYSSGTKSLLPATLPSNARNGAGFLSPGRRAAQLGGQRSQIAPAESSPMRMQIARDESESDEEVVPQQDGLTDNGLLSATFGRKTAAADSSPVKTSHPMTKGKSPGVKARVHFSDKKLSNAFVKSVGKSVKTLTSEGKLTASGPTEATNELSETKSGNENDAWKPYFKSKTSQKSGNSKKPTPSGSSPKSKSTGQLQVTNTGKQLPSDEATTSVSAPENENGGSASLPSQPTFAQPDQEPTFSSDRNTASSTEAPTTGEDQAPKVPKGSAPPPADSPEPATTVAPVVVITTTASPIASMESEADSTASTSTTPAPVSSEPPQTGTTVPTTEAPVAVSTSVSSVPESTSTTSAPETGPVTTTTTTPSPTTTNPATGELANSEEALRKKKRGTVAGVEYVKERRAPKAAKLSAKALSRANSSSVEYAL